MSKKEVPEEIKRDCVKLWRDFNYNLTRLADLSGLGIAEVHEYVHEYVREEQHAPKNGKCYDALRRKIVSELTQFRAGKPGGTPAIPADETRQSEEMGGGSETSADANRAYARGTGGGWCDMTYGLEIPHTAGHDVPWNSDWLTAPLNGTEIDAIRKVVDITGLDPLTALDSLLGYAIRDCVVQDGDGKWHVLWGDGDDA